MQTSGRLCLSLFQSNFLLHLRGLNSWGVLLNFVVLPLLCPFLYIVIEGLIDFHILPILDGFELNTFFFTG